ncbi:MAG: NADP-dependent oxidoreductase [Candidatus Nanopelagicales bacterium]
MTRAVYYDQFGGPEVLRIGEVDPLPMGPDTVKIAVAGAGINPVDYKVMRGYLAGAFECRFPIVPGWDVAGTVLETGPSVPELKPGDRVFAYARMDWIQHGTLGDEVTMPIRHVVAAPSTIDLVHAAAVPLVGLTALQLVRRLDVRPQQTVLVHNAAGGVGQFAVQLARLAGARVLGTASPANHDHLRSLGVEPVAYGSGMADAVRTLAPAGVDVVADLIGGVLDDSDALLAPGGLVGSIADARGALARNGVYVFVRPSRNGLTELAQLIDSGDLQVDVAATYPFEEAADAYRLLEGGHVRGKVVVVP